MLAVVLIGVCGALMESPVDEALCPFRCALNSAWKRCVSHVLFQSQVSRIVHSNFTLILFSRSSVGPLLLLHCKPDEVGKRQMDALQALRNCSKVRLMSDRRKRSCGILNVA